MSRGFCAIALDNPKKDVNVGGVYRSAYNFDASLIVVSGHRVQVRHAADTVKAYRSIPLIRTEDVLDNIPFDCVPVAVDIVPGAIPLHEYKHPERAFYIFGAEDNTLGTRILSRCRESIIIQSRHCLNLASAVSVVLYDRTAKQLLNSVKAAA